MAVTIDRSFRAEWTAEVLAARPPILPRRHFVYPAAGAGGGGGGARGPLLLRRRHFVYPAAVEEVERGALELMVRPAEGEAFLATCALGFASPAVPTGVWSC